MWFLFLISVLNACLDNKGFVLEHRINIAGLPINVMDGLMLVGVLAATFGVFAKRSRFETQGTHPLMMATFVLFMVGLLVGAVGAATNGTTLYQAANEIRSFASFPVCMILGYMFLKTPDSSRKFAYIHIVSGIACAGLILLFFVGKSAEDTKVAIDNIRATQYISYYAGLAAALLLYTILSRQLLLPSWLGFPILGFCLVGQFATLSRSDWISAFMAMFAIPFILPREGRAIRVVWFAAAVPIMGAMLIGGALLVAQFSGRSMQERLSNRLESLMPTARGNDSSTSGKAWDTRIPGIIYEMKLFLENPVMGQGFGHSITHAKDNSEVAFNHNVWSSSLATTGVWGFAAYMVPLVGIIVIGKRMVRVRLDKGSMLMGAIGMTTGVYAIILGLCTMSFNVQRGGMAIGLLCGLVIRARAMQLAMMEQYAGYVEFDPNFDPDGGQTLLDGPGYGAIYPDDQGYGGTRMPA